MVFIPFFTLYESMLIGCKFGLLNEHWLLGVSKSGYEFFGSSVCMPEFVGQLNDTTVTDMNRSRPSEFALLMETNEGGSLGGWNNLFCWETPMPDPLSVGNYWLLHVKQTWLHVIHPRHLPADYINRVGAPTGLLNLMERLLLLLNPVRWGQM
jgi:hypothetical protein